MRTPRECLESPERSVPDSNACAHQSSFYCFRPRTFNYQGLACGPLEYHTDGRLEGYAFVEGWDLPLLRLSVDSHRIEQKFGPRSGRLSVAAEAFGNGGPRSGRLCFLASAMSISVAAARPRNR